ncbi:peroxisomal fatty acid beta-oxidation multifunctional protein AIM1-like [Arachis ipaensis]|uniref:peroxisomal fatty acid beta-oxidation multifunctional protein AIM1-like n=1 Tax=Arachis ipaensis TaxID=130454 RepID=UPI000A2B0F51|nr:peroxisomal fatty acid beta-oxidation multifunctional protein AIM1-like [Arachis ipaensis]
MSREERKRVPNLKGGILKETIGIFTVGIVPDSSDNNHQGKRWLHEGDSYIRHSYIEEHDWDKILKFSDLAGYGVAVAISKEFEGSFRGLTYKSPLLDLMIKSGRNGKNNGKGYYIYEKGSKPKLDLSILPIVEESRRFANIMPGGKPISITDHEIVEMILFLIVNEACRVLDERMVIQASDLDIACVLGMSFPSYSPACFMISFLVGAKDVYNSLKKWSELYGNFYKPSRYLEERAIQGISLAVIYILCPN